MSQTFQKCSKTASVFNMFKCKSSSRQSPVHFLSKTFAHRRRHPRKQRPYYFGDPRRHHTRETKDFAPESVKSPVEIPTLPNCCTSQELDSEVDIMMWLT